MVTAKVTELVTKGAESIGHCNKWDQLAQEASITCKMIQVWGTLGSRNPHCVPFLA